MKKYGIIGSILLGTASAVYWVSNNWHSVLNLYSLRREIKEIEANKVGKSKTTTTRILAIGDSLTAGYGVTQKESYPGQLEDKLKTDGYDVEVINAGKNGETTSGLLARIEKLKEEKPDMVLITIGGNDAMREKSPKEIKENLENIVKSLKEIVPSDKIFLMQIQMPPIHGLKYMIQFNSIYPKIAKQEKVNILSFVVPQVFLEKTLMQSDYIHPNSEGYKKIVEQYIYQKIQQEI